jgi:Secretion system C-terminal sorting domain
MGTDHGTAAPVMFFGEMLHTGTKRVKNTPHPVSGMIGTSPVLPTNPDVDQDVPMQFDFRQIYSTIMQDWLCLSEAQATKILGKNFEKLPIFGDGLLENNDFNPGNAFMVVYPNPVANNQVNLLFNSVLKSNVQASIYNMLGAKVYSNSYFVDSDSLTIQSIYMSTGTYILEVVHDNEKHVEKLIVL